MPKPDTITAADEARWHAEIVHHANEHPDILNRTLSQQTLENPRLQVMYYTGAWLGEQLSAAGCPQNVIDDICFANRQRVAFSPDPWGEATAALDEWKATGKWEKPGPELGARLFTRDFPEHAKPNGPRGA